ncbi:unnamed protein product [Caenorhabditis angaria]|uniref:Uncharacterized protein n=1 Tax=Caenorhabditis angaria TaxID=860376 RepID=A0A9P1N4S2_9PELO|nr:unnamed protein product [Caenorhabditis angaria]
MCFIRKHQAIAKISKTQQIPNILYKCVITIFIVIPFFIFAFYYYSGLSHNEQLEYISKNYPEYLHDFQNLRDFFVGVPNSKIFLFFIFILISETISVNISIYTTIQMFRLLRDFRHCLSNDNYNKHRNAIKSLLAQFCISFMTTLPPLEIIASYFLNFQQNAQLFSHISLMVYATHSVINIIVCVISFPAYRKFTFGLFRKKTEKFRTTIGVSILL